MFIKKKRLSIVGKWNMKKQIVIVIILGVTLSFAVGLIIGWMVPIDLIPSTGEHIIPGDRSHLIGSWKGPTEETTFSMSFFENGSLLFSKYRGNYTIDNSQLVLHSLGVSISAEYFFLGDYDTLGLRNIQGGSAFPWSFLGTPYGILLRRA
jgi:hypothetical protein